SSLPGLTRQSINLRRGLLRRRWTRGSSPRVTAGAVRPRFSFLATPPRLPRRNALKVRATSRHGERNERTQENREEDYTNKGAGERGAEKSGESEGRAEARAAGAGAGQQRRTDHLVLQAHRPSPARRIRRHGRGYVDSDRARRPPHPLARA